MTRLLPHILVFILLACLSTGAGAQRTTRPRLRVAAPSEPEPECIVRPDSLVSADSVAISFRGYDKPLRSHRESFFAMNGDSTETIAGFSVTITYYDTAGRMLHRRSANIVQDIPPGETRRVDIPSWDRNNVYYYYLSTRPTRSAASPYKITLRADSVALRRPSL